MTLEDFKSQVEDAFPYGVEYTEEVSYEYLIIDGEPEATMTVKFSSNRTYELTLIVGEDGKVGINTYDYSTIEMSQESVFAWCLFEEQAKNDALKEKRQ